MRSRQYVLVAITLSISLACNTISNFKLPGGPASSGEVDRRLVFNEVLFFPRSGDSAFIEIKALENQAELSGVYILNDTGKRIDLPAEAPAISADEYFLIIFDGSDQIQPGVLHADRLDYLSQESGYLDLFSADGSRLDHVAWGPDQPDTVNLSRGGFISTLEPGTSIGRFPLSTNVDPLEWTIFPPIQTTQGAANPQPGVEVLLPLNGAVMTQEEFDLSWYPIPGANEYHVQVAMDEVFGTPVIDETVSAPPLAVQLSPGFYYWRVQAISMDGQAADYSPVHGFSINPGFSKSGHTASRLQADLNVPFISQHKDTAMLLLESKREQSEHAWDKPHPDLDMSDPADNTNCTLASIAMVNAYYQGKLSQDRIGFEVRNGLAPGPEHDLLYGRGLNANELHNALKYSLGAEANYQIDPASLDVFWAVIKKEIDGKRPILATKPGHAFVITGYSEQGPDRFVFINDPWTQPYAVNLDDVTWTNHWLMPEVVHPASDEPEIKLDSDGDGMVDFDEVQRFGTNPNDPDTEKDNLKDKQDVRGSIFDEHFGYAVTQDLLGRDKDGDGLKMELDVDSDDGGCFDGMEDYDYDGKFVEPETWNFDDGDDACITGTDEILLDENQIYDDGNHHQRLHTLVTFSLRAIERGQLEGLAQIQYSHTGEFNYPDCSGTHDIGLQYYQSQLQGEFIKMPGQAGTFISIQATPANGDPYLVQWNISCQGVTPPYEEYKGWSWPGQGGQLVDGVYDTYTDMSANITNGEFWQKTHMEQGGLEP